MRVLFVAPSETSSGEVVTALHMAEALRRAGDDATFLASRPAAAFLRPRFGDALAVLTDDRDANLRLWREAVGGVCPDVIVFADYPLLFFSSGAPPLADPSWVNALDACDAALVTLDHLGYAQGVGTVHFGPAHLSFHAESPPPLPPRMRVLLPCPGQHPGFVPGRVGEAFRYWDDAGPVAAARTTAARARFAAEGELLLFHAIPKWAQAYVAHYGLPHYAFLTPLLERYVEGLDRPVVLASVNDGETLAPSSRPGLRVVNLRSLPPDEFESLLLGCDLMLTDNSISVGLGKAICAGTPAAALCNGFRLVELVESADEPMRRIVLAMERARPGAIFPYEVFPIWDRDDLDALGVLRDNAIARAFARLEIFGGEATRARIQGLLVDPAARASLRAAQDSYADAVRTLPDPVAVLHRVTRAS